MFTSRTATRTAAVLGATAALTLAGAGAASATTHESAVDGNDVSVTFELEGGITGLTDSCGAVLTPTAAAAGIAAEFAGGNVEDTLRALVDNENVTVLYKDGIITDTPFALMTLADRSATVSATDVPSNVYALVSVCLSDPSNPTINPMVLVGDPMEAIMGSVEMGSSNGGLDTASALLEGGGLDTASALLGGGEGELDLGVLSSALGDEADTEA